jgi:hypothetical protein
VPRGSGGYRPPAHAAARHPQPGKGYHHGGYYGGHSHGGHYGKGRYYGGRGYYGYRGYYPYYRGYPYYAGYYPYYYPNYYPYYPYYGYSPWGVSLSVGGPYFSASASYNAEPSYSASPSYEAPPREAVDPPGRPSSSDDTGRLRLDVRPADASVYVDDEFWGTAADTRSVRLRSGVHSIEVVRPGFATVRRDVAIVRGETRGFEVDLSRQ